jgi:hypothetical protein
MKSKYLVLAGVGLATLSAMVAAESPAMLLKAKSIVQNDRGIVATDATVIVGEMQISASEITFDRDSRTLKCAGEATIRAKNGATVKAQAATIEVGEGKLFSLSAGTVELFRTGRADFDFTKNLNSPPQ